MVTVWLPSGLAMSLVKSPWLAESLGRVVARPVNRRYGRGGRDHDRGGVPGVHPRCDQDVDDVVVDRNRRNHHAGPAFTVPSPEQAGVDHHPPGYPLHSLGRDLTRQRPDDRQGISVHRHAGIGVVFVLEGQRSIGTDPVGEVGIAAGDQHQISLERSIRRDRAGTIHRV
jgi:hypothetical protein